MTSLSATLSALLVSVKKMKLFLADTLALSELYVLDSREFPLAAPEFKSTPNDLIGLRARCVEFTQAFSKITEDNKYEDGFILLRQLVHSIELLKPLEPTLTSWQNTFLTLQTLYFTLLVVLNCISDVAIFITHSTTDPALAGGSALSGGFMSELLTASRKETNPQLFDDLKSVKFGAENILHYAARTVKPLDSAFGAILNLVNSGSSKAIGLNTQTTKNITSGDQSIPAGSTFLHTLSRRLVEEPPRKETAKSLATLRSYGSSPRILDSTGQSVLSILSAQEGLRGGESTNIFQETLVALEGGATESQRGRAAFIRQKYYTAFYKKSNVARVWLNAVVHDSVTVPFPTILLMDDSWINAWGFQLIRPADNGNHFYTSVEEFKADFPQTKEGIPYIHLEDLLNEDSYSFRKGGMFKCNIDKEWRGSRDEAEVVDEAAQEAGFETFALLPPKKQVLGSLANLSRSAGGGGGGGSAASAASAGGSAGGSADADLARAYAEVDRRRAERLAREAEELRLQTLASEVAQAEEQERLNKRRVADAAKIDPDKLIKVDGGYRPIDRHALIKVAGLTYRFDNDAYYLYNTLIKEGVWEPVNGPLMNPKMDPKYYRNIKAAQFA